MSWLKSQPPVPKNEPVLEYRSNSLERKNLACKLKEFSSTQFDLPVIVNGKEIRTGQVEKLTVPYDHQRNIGQFHKVTAKELELAMEGALRAKNEWAYYPTEEKAAIFLRAAELLATEWRPTLNAATMLNQAKTCHQAEIDAACELIDFYRFNVAFQEDLYKIQPQSGPGQWNQLEYRPLEGFVFAVTPFNFTSIAGNLPTSPVLMGNVCLWKVASTAVLSGYYVYKLLEKAGLPPGVIQFLPGSGGLISDTLLKSPHLAGIHFTGSTEVFNSLWKGVGENLSSYNSYPRLVGETGGKDFVFVHPSSESETVACALVRGAFEYQGQKCSAASRAYIPKSLWPAIKDKMLAELKTITLGDPLDFKDFMSAVIDKKAFERVQSYIEYSRKSSEAKIISGGECDSRKGFFIQPTVIEVSNPKFKTMTEEIFGPVLSVYVYEDSEWEDTLEICNSTSPYALTGAFFATDRKAVEIADMALKNAAGNYYINNKPTGAVVGQQPFGGARASGTNDKAGSLFNLIRWVSMRTISETFVPPRNYRYPFLGE